VIAMIMIATMLHILISGLIVGPAASWSDREPIPL
jgi:hypothetical protein